MLDELDRGLILAINQFAQRSVLFDEFVAFFLSLEMVKLQPLVMVMIGLWFSRTDQVERRISIGQSLLGALIAMTASRLIQNLVSERARPIHDPTLGFVAPHDVSRDILRDWSSFPSDTTALAFALATGILLASRPLGIVAILWAAVVVGLPRVYVGFHYPGDILGGAVIGVVAVVAWNGRAARERIGHVLARAEALHAPLFYALGFAFLMQIVTLFDEIRRAARVLGQLIERFAQ